MNKMDEAIQFMEIARNYGSALKRGVVDMWNNFHISQAIDTIEVK